MLCSVGPNHLCCNYSTLPLQGKSIHGQCVLNGCGCFNKTLFTKTGSQAMACSLRIPEIRNSDCHTADHHGT